MNGTINASKKIEILEATLYTVQCIYGTIYSSAEFAIRDLYACSLFRYIQL